MKFGSSFLLHAVLGYLLTLFLPWWSVVLLAIVLGATMKISPIAAFGAGFAAMFSLWSIYAGYLDSLNGAMLSQQIAELFKVGSPNNLIYITGLIGGLLGGFGAMTGALGRSLFLENNKR